MQPPPVPVSSSDEAPGGPVGSSRAQLTAARARLDDVGDLPLADRVIAFDEVHQLLQDALAGAQQVLSSASAAPSGS